MPSAQPGAQADRQRRGCSLAFANIGGAVAGRLAKRWATMDTLLVQSVDPYSPGDECASVTLRSAQAEIVAFCHPCSFQAGERIKNRLSVLDATVSAAYLSDWSEQEKQERSIPVLEKIGLYAYRGCGFVTDRDSGLVDVLGFCIDFGELPCDGYVEFEITRVNV